MALHHYLAFDFGAESGRALLGTLENGKISLQEVHRFPNGMLTVRGRYHWNIFRLYEEIKKSISICVNDLKIQPESLAFDTWGVDFALLGADGSFLGLPYAYRDPHTNTAIEEVDKLIPKKRIYELTGIQFAQYNSLFQLYALQKNNAPQLSVAKHLLFMPDIFNYLLTGEMKTDFTFATTSQLYNPNTNNWEVELFNTIGIDPKIMNPIVKPGTVIGYVSESVCKETGLKPIPVIAVASHDTGSAIAAIPAEGENWAYISSGTWSLMGVESPKAVINDDSMACNFTNEGGVEGTFRTLKNIMGLWLLQETRRAWSKDKKYEYSELVVMAENAKPFEYLIDPDDSTFLNPESMPEAIKAYCKKTGQKVPEKHEEIVRCIFDSLALKYRYVAEQIKRVTGNKVEKINIIGGGSQNKLLCQLTADACDAVVIAGPSEGTGVGNLLMQSRALGHINSLDELRKIVKNSFETHKFTPKDKNIWDLSFSKFLKINKL